MTSAATSDGVKDHATEGCARKRRPDLEVIMSGSGNRRVEDDGCDIVAAMTLAHYVQYPASRQCCITERMEARISIFSDYTNFEE